MKQLRRKLRQSVASFLALCLTMTSFNMVSWADVEKAFDSGNAIFMISGEELRNSAQAAIDAGETFQVDDLGLGDKDQSLKREYEKLFGKGHVYEFSPGYYMDEEASADGAELRMFIRTADTDGEYLLTGDEEVIFLYVNESDEKITFRSNIDGYLTQKVSVKAFSEGTTAIPNVPEVKPEPTLPDESAVNPEETETAEETEEESEAVDETEDAEETGSTEETEEDGNVEESSKAEDGTEDAEEGSEAESGSEETADDEDQADSEGSSDDTDTVSEDSDAGSSDNGGSEAEDTDSGASHEGSGAQASISRHMLSVLTSSDVTALEEGTPSEAEPEVEEEPVVVGTTKGKTYGAILLDESYYAKAYVTTLNQLNVDTTAEGYRITYSVEPVGTAYAEGPKTVEENGTLSFKVTPQVGYEISSVTINGETSTADEAGDGRTLSYTVTEVTEEQEVVIMTAATGEHPEFSASIPMEDGTVIHIYAAEGILPAGVKAVASVVKGIEDVVKENVEADAAAAGEAKKVIAALSYNIDLLDQDSNKLDDRIWGGVVEVTFTGSPIEKYSKEADIVEVVYVATTKEDIPQAQINAEDVISVESVSSAVKVTGNEVVFDAEHFSIYTVVTSVTPPEQGNFKTITVRSFYENGLSAGEVYKAEIPETNGTYEFSYSVPLKNGYHVELEEGTPGNVQLQAGGNLTGTFSDKEPITITVIYRADAANYTVRHQFQNIDGTQYIEDTSAMRTLPGKTGELTDAQPLERDGFTVQRPIAQTEITADGNTSVNVYYNRNVYRLTYETNGGSYVSYQKGLYESTQTVASGPTKLGYIFDGWYRNAEGTGGKVTSTIILESDVTLYAKWKSASVNYTIVYLTENADDFNYSYFKSDVKQAVVGTTVTVRATDSKPSGLDSTNFTFKEASSAVVKPDGSTVIYVRYSRNVYTITWKTSRRTVTLTAKYGASITQLWKETFNNPYPQYAWSFTQDEKDKFINIDTMPSGNKTLYTFGFNTTNVQTLHYWLENYSGSGIQTKVYNGVTYGLYKAIDVRFNYLYDKSEFYEIVGYTKGSYEGCTFGAQTRNKQQVHFYYRANSYNLDLYGYNGVKLSNQQVKIGVDLAGYLTPPASPVQGAVFKGWYVDPEHTELNSATKMPTGLALYADWDLPGFTVVFKNQTETVETKNVSYNNTVEAPASPVREGYSFTGWYTNQDGTGQEFDPAMKFTNNAVYYAGWDEDINTKYTVKYVTSNGDSVAADKVGSGVVGESVLERAVVPEGAYSGYTVDSVSKTLTLRGSVSDNVIVFTYYTPGELSFQYTIEYVDEDGDVIYSVPEKTSQVNKITVYPDTTLSALNGYQVTEGFIIYDLSNEEENKIVFHCISQEFSIEYRNITGVTWGGDKAIANPNPLNYTVKSLLGNPITLINPNKVGYTFAGWDYDESMVVSGTAHNELTTVIEHGSYGNLIFTAKYVKDESQTKTLKATVYHK
ncbi:InlB B-repeat-containing protein, partial [Lacrimispora sp.]|uniref:InlB B-repeat-containing protein n=1 Tax=Lacrimispora sp. TaxID=2719234 RepID=UPI002FDA1004